MPKKIMVVRVEKTDGNSLSSSFVAKVGPETLVMTTNSDLELFAIHLASRLEEIGNREDCGFTLIDAISKKEWEYDIYSLASLGIGERGLQVTPQLGLPGFLTINKRFYNLLAGRSKPKGQKKENLIKQIFCKRGG
ncbi:MAG: hypothetical protein PF572_03975 [Patescibacteria group bacterium]|jgi:hypothetical protein|nr:hypothetical protein [Patescibacteria group bacterium]